MLASKDFVINVFKEEIDRKNQLIEQLLKRQEELEEKLQNIEEVLAFNDKNGIVEEESQWHTQSAWSDIYYCSQNSEFCLLESILSTIAMTTF